jgi:hypothetical protein
VYESETRRNTADQVADYANYWLIPSKEWAKGSFWGNHQSGHSQRFENGKQLLSNQLGHSQIGKWQ